MRRDDAKADLASVTVQQMRGMLRTLLADRFRLAFHREFRQITGLALVIAKGGHKLKPGDPTASQISWPPLPSVERTFRF